MLNFRSIFRRFKYVFNFEILKFQAAFYREYSDTLLIGDNNLTSSQAKAHNIEKLFEYDKNQSSPVFYNLMQEYFRKSVEAAIGNDGSNSSTNNVSYENWKKN